MATMLRAGREWDKRIKVDSGTEAPVLDPNNPIGAAVLGRVIRDINNGNFETIGNLLITAGAFNVKGTTEREVVFGREQVTVMQDKNKQEHEVTDSNLVKAYLDSGMVIVRTETRDIMG